MSTPLSSGHPCRTTARPKRRVPAATRVPRVLGAILVDATTTGIDDAFPALGDAGRRAIEPAIAYFGDQASGERILAGVMVWMAIFGAISFELFGEDGSVANTPEDSAAFFDACIALWSVQGGFA